MQENPTAFPQWILTALQWLAMFGAGSVTVKLITLWQNRRKPAVEIHKTEAETTEITIRSHATAGDSMIRLMNRLERAVTLNENLRAERDDLQEKNDKLEMEVESYDRQMKRMKGFMDSRGLKYSDMDEPR